MFANGQLLTLPPDGSATAASSQLKLTVEKRFIHRVNEAQPSRGTVAIAAGLAAGHE